MQVTTTTTTTTEISVEDVVKSKGIEFPISILVFLFASLHANIFDFINSNRNASAVNGTERESDARDSL